MVLYHFWCSFWLMTCAHYNYTHAQANFPMVSIDGPASDENPNFKFEIQFPGGNYGGLFLFLISPEDSKKIEQIEVNSRGDAFLFNAVKFVSNLIYHIRRESGEPNSPIPILQIHPRPLARLGARCDVPADRIDILRGFILGGFGEQYLLPGNPFIDGFAQPCTPAGFLPLLLCLGPLESDGSIKFGTCACSFEASDSRWTTFTYTGVMGLPGTPEAFLEISCVGNVGSICRDPDLTCNEDLICEPGTTYPAASFCGGELGSLARGFGGGIRFTDELLPSLVNSQNLTNAELENQLIRISNSQDVLGRDCNPTYWTWVTHAVLPIIKLVKSTDPNYSIDYDLFTTTQTIPIISTLFQYHLAAELNSYKLLDFVPVDSFYDVEKHALTVKRAEYYETGEACLNDFPRTACIKKPLDPERGLCQCATKEMTGSREFDYFEQEGQCVGGEGAICTTVRGSGDHICATGLVCQTPLADVARDSDIHKRIPGPLAHHLIKVCTLPPSQVQEDFGSLENNSETTMNGSFKTTFDLYTALSFWYLLIIVCTILAN